MEVIVVIFEDRVQAFRSMDGVRKAIRAYITTFDYTYEDDREDMLDIVEQSLYSIPEATDEFFAITDVDIEVSRVLLEE